MSGLKWEPIYSTLNAETVIGWELKGRYLPLKVLQDDEGHWFGYFEHGEDMPSTLVSTSHVAAKREFLKLCLRRSRLVSAELEDAWRRLGQVKLAEQKAMESEK